MRILRYLLFIHALAAGFLSAQTPPDTASFGFESAQITFSYAGFIKGSEILYIQDWGATRVLVSDKTRGPMREHKTLIWQDGTALIIDHLDKRIFQQTEMPPDLDLSVYGADSMGLVAKGLIRLPDATVLGKVCEVYQRQRGDQLWETFRWEGIELKVMIKHLRGGGSYRKLAESLLESGEIPKNILEIPEGYRKE